MVSCEISNLRERVKELQNVTNKNVWKSNDLSTSTTVLQKFSAMNFFYGFWNQYKILRYFYTNAEKFIQNF